MIDTNSEKGRIVVAMKKLYSECQKKMGNYKFYNLLEKYLIEVELSE